jgi:hypothetical protein
MLESADIRSAARIGSRIESRSHPWTMGATPIGRDAASHRRVTLILPPVNRPRDQARQFRSVLILSAAFRDEPGYASPCHQIEPLFSCIASAGRAEISKFSLARSGVFGVVKTAVPRCTAHASST